MAGKPSQRRKTVRFSDRAAGAGAADAAGGAATDGAGAVCGARAGLAAAGVTAGVGAGRLAAPAAAPDVGGVDPLAAEATDDDARAGGAADGCCVAADGGVEGADGGADSARNGVAGVADAAACAGDVAAGDGSADAGDACGAGVDWACCAPLLFAFCPGNRPSCSAATAATRTATAPSVIHKPVRDDDDGGAGAVATGIADPGTVGRVPSFGGAATGSGAATTGGGAIGCAAIGAAAGGAGDAATGDATCVGAAGAGTGVVATGPPIVVAERLGIGMPRVGASLARLCVSSPSAFLRAWAKASALGNRRSGSLSRQRIVIASSTGETPASGLRLDGG